MWARAGNDNFRHDFGGQNPPLAICGYKGEYPINYGAINIPKCQVCLSLWPTYGKKKESKRCGEESEK